MTTPRPLVEASELDALAPAAVIQYTAPDAPAGTAPLAVAKTARGDWVMAVEARTDPYPSGSFFEPASHPQSNVLLVFDPADH